MKVKFQTFPRLPKLRSRYKRWLKMAIAIVLVSLSAIACNLRSSPTVSSVSNQPTSELPTLQVWWDKGFNQDEDEALNRIIKNWEAQSGVKVQLFLQTPDDLLSKAQRAIQAGTPPDVLYSDLGSGTLFPRFAWEGKLLDLSDIIEPQKALYPQSVLDAVHLYNNVEKKRSYYAIPIQQSSIHIFYWRDLLQQAGITTIPEDWQGFWQVWETAKTQLRNTQNLDIEALGLTLSVGSADTNFLFEQMLEAFDVELLDAQGQVLANDPKLRQNLANLLTWYAQHYRQGAIAPDAIEWLSPDNNIHLLNRTVLMTPNATLSIPGSQRQNREIYLNQLGTVDFPKKPSGEPMRHLTSVRQVIVFKNARQSELAKDFLRYISQPETLAEFLKQSGGRYFPVLSPVWKDPFWQDRADPHISAVTKTLLEKPTRTFYTAINPAYSQVQEDYVWGKALHRVIVEGVSPEQAAAEAIARIQEIFAQWQ
ncbi:ABC transporter substrate-binding protein [Oscillatoria amoena NRMC-F 0135]|nr:ABC transporter substrate-binding protein [Geitlerinema splendidum]MDL5047477.1 ABC transporter substrate-binding protein [Oscillatoria amoena NRMC-F 0135]